MAHYDLSAINSTSIVKSYYNDTGDKTIDEIILIGKLLGHKVIINYQESKIQWFDQDGKVLFEFYADPTTPESDNAYVGITGKSDWVTIANDLQSTLANI